ncbi:MAG: hypothetical protein RLZZ385_716 [Pseudomonadota bacterium]|jgi:hypothetical protein
MSNAKTQMNQWRERLQARLPAPLAGLLGAGSNRELLQQAATTLLVFDGRLIHLQTGHGVALESRALEPESLASAARKLMVPGQPVPPILLLLPPAEFVSTTIAMPGLAREAALAALQLQVDSLLPSLNEPMAVSVNPAATQPGQYDIALWIGETRLDQLFAAFAAQDLSLVAVMPRPLYLAPPNAVLNVLDEDEDNLTSITISHGVLHEWLQVPKWDLQQDEFRQQWQQAVQPAVSLEQLAIRDSKPFVPPPTGPALEAYCFFPRGALLALQRQVKGKRLAQAAMAAGLVLLMSALPFLAQTFQIQRLNASLETQRELSQGPRQDRHAVQAFEDDWGPLVDFPEQNVRQTLFNLQSILNPERLTSFELSEGVITIEGLSAEPQGILQRLEQDPMFTEVAFSRATSNTRYYIGLRLSTVNFEGYLVRHFPDN